MYPEVAKMSTEPRKHEGGGQPRALGPELVRNQIAVPICTQRLLPVTIYVRLDTSKPNVAKGAQRKRILRMKTEVTAQILRKYALDHPPVVDAMVAKPYITANLLY